MNQNGELDFLNHSQTLGRISAASMLGYFLIGPYVNILLFENPAAPSIAIASLGAAQMAVIVFKPQWFSQMTLFFAAYAAFVLYLTA